MFQVGVEVSVLSARVKWASGQEVRQLSSGEAANYFVLLAAGDAMLRVPETKHSHFQK